MQAMADTPPLTAGDKKPTTAITIVLVALTLMSIPM
jgi:hypothetical protein